MCKIFDKREWDMIHNDRIKFYKLYIDDYCQFDDFYEEACSDELKCKAMDKIVAMMECFGEYNLPKKKFRQIKGGNRSDIFEFKEKNIRVYVLKKEPDVCIVMGGFKNDQEKDIKRLFGRVKDFELK